MANFWTTIEMKGTETELFDLLKIVRMYAVEKREQYHSEKNCAYLEGASIKNTGKGIDILSDDELLEVVKESDGQISIEASGPYGVYDFVNEVSLFEELADAAPTACFEGFISGHNEGEKEVAKNVFENGLLKTFYRYPREDDVNEWDSESVYIAIPSVDDPAMYVAQKVNKAKVNNIVFEKHGFAISESCDNEKTLIEEIEKRGGEICKGFGKNIQYVVIGKRVKGYDHQVANAIFRNAEMVNTIEVITESELLTLFQ